jgi:Tfp pilus assembly protein PilF
MILSQRRTRFHRTRNYLILIGWAMVSGIGLPSAAVHAQGGVDSMGTGGGHKISGRIYFPSGRRSDATAVKVTLDSTSSERLFVMADLNGTFTFHSIAPGAYTLTVDAGKDYELGREQVVIESLSIRSRNVPASELARANVPRTFNVMITLQLKRGTANKAAVISAVLAAVPAGARDAYNSGVELARQGETKKAVEEFKRAVALYPPFPLALNELGTQYLRLGQVEQATQAFESGLKITPDDFHLRLNYGVALLNQRKFAKSEEELRAAVNKNPSSPTAHMYLGIALAVQRKLDEANKELEMAIASHSTEVALAHRYLGGVLLEKRDYRRAADQLETYLKLQPKAADSEVLQQKIKELRNKT